MNADTHLPSELNQGRSNSDQLSSGQPQGHGGSRPPRRKRNPHPREKKQIKEQDGSVEFVNHRGAYNSLPNGQRSMQPEDRPARENNPAASHRYHDNNRRRFPQHDVAGTHRNGNSSQRDDATFEQHLPKDSRHRKPFRPNTQHTYSGPSHVASIERQQVLDSLPGLLNSLRTPQPSQETKFTSNTDKSNGLNATAAPFRLKREKKRVDEGDPDSQRNRFEEQLRAGEYECMVCCDEVRARGTIWSCCKCYNIFHLKCIKTWAQSNSSENQAASVAQAAASASQPTVAQAAGTETNGEQSTEKNAGWRCPACQHVHDKIPNRYYCFCGKRRDPAPGYSEVPHSCGQVCGRTKESATSESEKEASCHHKCNLHCHPGPCPPCKVMVTRACRCGATSMAVPCGSPTKAIHCVKPCNKLLACKVHACFKPCHSEECDPCDKQVHQTCHCGRQSKTVACTVETGNVLKYSCKEKCAKSLSCGKHMCEIACHSGQCPPCALSPQVVTHCPCKKTPLKQLPKAGPRSSCTDWIATCGQVCGKQLGCGGKEEPHTCPRKCHNGPCSPCKLKTVIRCKCGANSECLNCKTLTPEQLEFSCKKRCNKKLSCGRHKCIEECCLLADHPCSQPCGKKLACGDHNCQEVCHRNICGSCWNVSWDELTCRCGASVLYPPIQCGTKPPACDKLCTRDHRCGHPVDHRCHSEVDCPPCTMMVSKKCYGGHEMRTAVLCYMEGVSCGKRCDKPMGCGIHKCQRVCHQGDCGQCNYPCPVKRINCEHSCNLNCHYAASKMCPASKCKILVQVTCACHRLTDKMTCGQVNDVANRIPTSLMARLRVQSDQDLDVQELIRRAQDNKYCRLECDQKCSLIERNKKLADALDIKPSDHELVAGPPAYPETLKQAAMENPDFVGYVYEKLVNLVNEAKRSKMAFKNHNFEPMRADQRHVIHELAEFFGCKSHGVDQEPQRSVTVKALKERSFLPTVSLLDVVNKKTNWLVLGGTKKGGAGSSGYQSASGLKSVAGSFMQTGTVTEKPIKEACKSRKRKRA